MSFWSACSILSWASVLGKENLLSIDFGSQYFKSYLVSGGKLDAVLNLEAKRKTPNVVSFREAIRQFGDSGLALQGRDHKTTLLYFRYLLGKNLTGLADVSPGKLGFDEKYYPFNIFAHKTRKVPAFKVGDKEMVVEEVAAHVLGFAKSLGESAAAGAEISQVMVTVPSSATQRQRRAVTDAAEIAGFKEISLVHETTSAAVDLAMKVRYDSSTPREKKTSNTLIFNMGSAHTEVSLVSVAPVEVLSQLVPSVRVLASITVEKLGGHGVDVMLANKMVESFKEKNPKLASIDGNVKAMKKLVIQAQATKLFLSANKDAKFSVECLHEDTDFTQPVSRQFLEEITAENFAQIGPAIDEVVALSGIEGGLAAIDDVEVIGGAWRIPKVQQILMEHINAARKPNEKLDLGKRLDAEEAMAEGAAFILANRSAGFRAKKILLTDITEFDHKLTFTAVDSKGNAKPKEYHKTFTILPKRTILNTFKRFHLTVDTDLRMDHIENDNVVTTYELKGFGEDKMKQYMKMYPKPTVCIEVGLDASGMFKVRSAHAVWEEKETMAEKVPKAVGNETLPVKPEVPEPFSRPKIVKIRRLPMQVVIKEEHLPLPMSEKDKKAAIDRYCAAQAFDANIKAKDDAKNTLEAFIYEVRNTMDSALAEKLWTTEAKEEISSMCAKLQDWLYEDDAKANKAVYEDKYKELEQKVSVIPAQCTMKTYINEVRRAIESVPIQSATPTSPINISANLSQPIQPPGPSASANQQPFTEEARTEIIAMCTMIQEWLNANGAKANKEAYELQYKQLEEKIAPFQDRTNQEFKKRKIIPEAEVAAAKWAGPWAAEAWAAAARTKDWAAALAAKAAGAVSPQETPEVSPAPPADLSAKICVGVTGVPVAFIGLFGGSGLLFALFNFLRCVVAGSKGPLLAR